MKVILDLDKMPRSCSECRLNALKVSRCCEPKICMGYSCGFKKTGECKIINENTEGYCPLIGRNIIIINGVCKNPAIFLTQHSFL